jgi:hypothetical protein
VSLDGAVRGSEPPAMGALEGAAPLSFGTLVVARGAMGALAVTVCVVPVFCGAGAPPTLLAGFEPAIAPLAAFVRPVADDGVSPDIERWVLLDLVMSKAPAA